MESEGYKSIIRSLTSKGCEVMLFHQGLGESCIFCMLMHAYKLKTGRPIVILTEQESRTLLLESCPDVDKVIQCGEAIYDDIANDEALITECNIRNFAEITFMFERGCSIKERVYRFLGLPMDTEYVRYPLKGADIKVVREYYEALGLTEGKTVFIVPSAICYGDNVVSMDFWKRLTASLKERGYEVYFNSLTPFIEGERHGFFSVNDLTSFVGLCGNVVGVRTGLLDLLSVFADARIQAIYPNEQSPCWDENPAYRNSPLTKKEQCEWQYRTLNIKNLLGADDVIEIIHSYEDEDEEIRNIVDQLR